MKQGDADDWSADVRLVPETDATLAAPKALIRFFVIWDTATFNGMRKRGYTG